MAMALTHEDHPLFTVNVPSLLRNDSGERFESRTILAKFRSDQLKAVIGALKEVRNYADNYEPSNIRFLLDYYDKVYRLRRIIEAVHGMISGELAERKLKEKFSRLESQCDMLIQSLIKRKGLNDRPFFMARTRQQRDVLWTSNLVSDDDLKKTPSLWSKTKATAREHKEKIKMGADAASFVFKPIGDVAKVCSAYGHATTAISLEEIWRQGPKCGACKTLPGSLLGKLGGARQDKHEAVYYKILPHLIERQKNRADGQMTKLMLGMVPKVGGALSGLATARKEWKAISGAEDEAIATRREHAFWLTEHFLTHDCELTQAIVTVLFGAEKMEKMKDLSFWDCRAIMYKAFK